MPPLSWVPNIRPTCRAAAPRSVLWLRRPVAVLLATLSARGTGGADVHVANFEERHHERLLLQRSTAAYEACFLRADAQPWFRRYDNGKYVTL